MLSFKQERGFTPYHFFLKKSDKGFIALTSAIVIVLVLVTITVVVSISGFLGRFNILNVEFKEKSYGLAEACVEVAIIKLANNPLYSPSNECVPVGDSCPTGENTCTIVSVEPDGSNKVIKAKAVFNESHTNLKATVDSSINNIPITAWKEYECDDFDPPPC